MSEPNTRIESFEDESGIRYRATMNFDDLFHEAARNVDGDFMARVAPQFGYEKIIRCRDCRYYSEHKWMEAANGIGTDVGDVCVRIAGGLKVEPDGYCWIAEPNEEA